MRRLRRGPLVGRAHLVRVLGTIAVIAASVGAAAGSTASATAVGWNVRTTGNATSSGGAVNGVACTAPSSCIGVGEYATSSASFQTVAETWNGTAWSVVATPNKPKMNNQLNSIACVTVGDCVAVGFSQQVDGLSGDAIRASAQAHPLSGGGSGSNVLPSTTLAETWDGTSWALQTSPNPSRVINQLVAVSCGAHGNCMAVGYITTGAGVTSALAESWDGTSWTAQVLPALAGSASSRFGGVACAQLDSCIATGSSTDSSGVTTTLAEAWNGTRWTVLPTLNPGTQDDQLTGIGCVSTTECSGVGSTLDANGTTEPLAETWNGSAWSIENVASVGGQAYSELLGVSCPAAGACTVVGDTVDTTGYTAPLIEAEKNGSYAVQVTPRVKSSSQSLLQTVSCATAVSCVAVGSKSGTALAETRNGPTWGIANPAAIAITSNDLMAVSCPATTSCEAVGWYQNTGETVSVLAESWNCSAWALQAIPAPTNSQLDAIACTSPTACEAVGSYSTDSPSATLTLAEQWNGTAWKIQGTPVLPGSASNQLSGISCTSSTACTAVGSSSDSTGATSTVAERWDGSSWTSESTPSLPGNSTFNAVSCSAPSACVAVGATTQPLGRAGLAEAWDGTAWSVQPTPNPGGSASVQNQLDGVACTNAANCIATGSYYSVTLKRTVTLAEGWQGSGWSVQPTFTPSTGSDNQLNSLVCTAPTACTAVGFSTSTLGYLGALSETWDGTTWSNGAARIPTGTLGDSDLNAVSCPGQGQCVAVGDYYLRDPNTARSLAESVGI